MVFKRRVPRTYKQMVSDSVWPRGGWSRAIRYIRHRINRLPDDSGRIARGVAAGVFISFTPLFGLHIILSALIAAMVRANLIATLLGTLFGNFVTIPFIAVASMKFGNLILGRNTAIGEHASVYETFVIAGRTIKHNFFAMFTRDTAEWSHLAGFWNDIFLPYMIGGTVLGIVFAVISYFLTEPIVAAYQKLRRKRLRERAEKLRLRAMARVGRIPDAPPPGDG